MTRSLLLAVVALATGCAISAGQTARTNGQGNVQVGVEPGVLGAAAGGTAAVAPAMNVAVRYGVSDTMDLGGRIGTNGLEFQTKFQVTEDDGVIISPAPSVELWFFAAGGAGGGFLGVPVPLLIDVPVGDNALVIGPRVHPRLAFGAGGGAAASVFTLSGGTTIGYAAKTSEGLKIFPELGFEIPLVAAAAAAGAGAGAVGVGTGVVFDFRVNLLIGKTK